MQAAVTIVCAACLTLVSCGRSEQTVWLSCAAGWRSEVAPVVRRLADDGLDIRTRYQGSGQLAGQHLVGARCDLFLAADARYHDGLDTVRLIPLREQRAGLLLADGVDPPRWDDLVDGRVSLSLARPEAAAISRVVRQTVGEERFAALRAAARVERTNVVEAANDAARLNMADAALVWDTTAAHYPDRRFVTLPELDGAVGRVQLAVLSDRPPVARVAAALQAALQAAAGRSGARLGGE